MASKKPPPPPAPVTPKCGPCGGTGEVPAAVRVGRNRRTVGQQAGICLACFGTGEATN
ncbi:hypothetical protein ACFVTC_41100 [Streptomyces sp. NPDC057950]|uniref:hypothetical protein n=1 Tax=Streptomyces sp. NPDC057950 TaxID=3346288 RepID=UPI0036EE0D28